ncbi:hypothetical protein [Streptomyces sp. NPDC015414]|uniref:hypothetical protein n=1 Tax=Streptomyces sp. NPDC015414 TaxID=3364957 RepID=UPI003701B9D5
MIITAAPDWRPAPTPQPGGELVSPILTAVNFSFTPIELDHPTRSASPGKAEAAPELEGAAPLGFR